MVLTNLYARISASPRRKAALSLVITLTLAAGAAQAQTDLYSNGSANPGDPGLSTGSLSGSGIVAPAGSAWSEVQDISVLEANALGGATVSLGTGANSFRLADDFDVPGTYGWRAHSVSLFVYQPTGSNSVTPASGVTVRVWNGQPGTVGATVISGDTSTNRLTASTFAGLYRIFNTDGPVLAAVPDTTRPVWRLEVSLNDVILFPGHYWLDWHVNPADAATTLFAPPVTKAGSRGVVGWNARQLNAASSWIAINDPGKPAISADIAQDLPFIVHGDVLTTPCGADYNADGFVTGDDFDAFVDAFTLGTIEADFNRDGFVTGDDFDLFSEAFVAGC